LTFLCKFGIILSNLKIQKGETYLINYKIGHTHSMLEHKGYKVDSDFQGGYVIKAKILGDWITVARYDCEHGESFVTSFVTEEQKKDIREYARRAYIL